MQIKTFGYAKALIVLVIISFASWASAEPSMQEVNQALKNGNITRAETLMKEVLSAHPESAKAHFKYSEILAAQGRIAEANDELSKAEKLQPGLAFAKPEAVNALKRKLHKNDLTTNNPTDSNPLLKWAGLAFVVFLIFAVMKAFRRPQTPSSFANNPQVANASTPQATTPPQGGGLGSSIAGGLATGAAVGAGIVAGEMLMHKVLDGNDNKNTDSNLAHHETTHPDYSDISGNEFVDSDDDSWDNNSSLSDSFDSDNSSDWS